jgi:protein O-GlcNAc transferase
MNIDKLLEKGIKNHRSGKLKEAEAIYRQIKDKHPDQPDALHLLGVIAYQFNDPDTAISLIGKAISINNGSSEYTCNLGNAFRLKGEYLKASQCYKEAIRLNPDHAEAYNNLGATLRSMGEHEEALECYNQAVSINPNYASAYCNLGNLYRELGNFEKARVNYQKSIELQPVNADAFKGLGETYLEFGKISEAKESLTRANEIKPGNIAVLNSLANIFHQMRNHTKAAELYQIVIDKDPDNADSYNNLGTALIDSGRVEEGVSTLCRAAKLNPDLPEVHYNIGKGLENLGRLNEALSYYQKSVDLNPYFSTAWNNMGNIYKDQGNCEKAISYYRIALDKFTSDTMKSTIPLSDIHSNIPLTMHYFEVISPDELFAEHRRWASEHASALRKYIPEHKNDISPDRRLRIGYVSPDFRVHSVAYFIQTLLAAHNRSVFEVFCYSNVSHPDPATSLFGKMADHWREIFGLPDETISDMIQKDRIDILVDLSGHTGNNRLTLFARKPAPVQVTYLGYPNTTGLGTMDYRITDSIADPAGITDKWHTEELIRLQNCFLCYKPPEGTPDIIDLPVTKSGYITFGSFNNRAKITQRSIDAWSKILHALPDSRLVLKAKSLTDPQVKKELLDLFARNNIDPGRITVLGFTASKEDHFNLYTTIDIALDTFPYNGTTTTCEALWMGVPVIALKGDIHVSRVSLSILSNIGLAELAADSADDYIAKAVNLARDTGRLNYLRHNLRTMMKESPLMDARSFVLNLENEYKTIWRKWCSHENAILDNISKKSPENKIRNRIVMKETGDIIREGEALFSSGHINDAMNIFQNVLESDPNNTTALNNLGVISCQTGHYARAEDYLNKAISLKPDMPAYHCNLGNVFKAKGEREKAVIQYERAIRLKPDFAQAHNNIGTVLKDLKKYPEAIASLNKAVAIQADYAEAFYNLGNVFMDTENHPEAIESYNKAISLNPNYVQAYNNLGNIFMAMGNLEQARTTFEMAIQVNPTYAQAHNNLGKVLKDLGRLEGALNAYRNAIKFQPKYANAYYNMANTLKDLTMHTEAVTCYLKAIEIQPSNPEAFNNLGNVYKDQGRIKDALLCYEKAVELKPEYSEAHSNLLLALHYNDSIDPQNIFSHHEDWAKRHASFFMDNILPNSNDRSVHRPIRIGYVSPDFRLHSVAYFMKGILSSHDPKEFDVYCYSDVKQPDSLTDKIKTLAHQWRDIRSISDEALADLIRQDKIDILVDLTGHTANNRMLVFARKPAPVQITYIGYPDTTGLKTMDYRITDSWADPLGQQDNFCSEELIRLPRGFLCYQPPEAAPQIKALPALSTGYVTFGSFNLRSKITVKAVQTWSEILHKIADSRLILKSGSFSDNETRQHMLDMFYKEGISKDRITLLGDIPNFSDHLELYNKMDIALDTFPYNGTTTTCEALWMGVPVIVLKGEHHMSRVGVSLLTNAGMEEFIAGTHGEYVEKAVGLAHSPERLSQMRERQRDTIASSSLMDTQRFTQDLENEYRKIWLKWCASDNELMIDTRNSSNPAESISMDMPSRTELAYDINLQGEYLFGAGRMEDALSAFHKALDIDPENVAAHNNIGVYFWQTGDHKMALQHFNEALRIDPENMDAISNRNDAMSALQQESQITEQRPRKLHIGGTKPNPEWEIFNALNFSHVDHIGNAKDLSRFADNTFDALYASHVLEHFDYQKELISVLREWYRVIKPGGKIYISVPDLDKLAYLFLQKETISLQDRFLVMRMILGGHMDEYDYHKVAFNGEILSVFLHEAGFSNLRVVDSFGIFDDSSSKIFNGVPISLNVIAEKDRSFIDFKKLNITVSNRCLSKLMNMFSDSKACPEILILGDSSMIMTSHHDTDKTPLKTMLINELSDSFVCDSICEDAFNPAVFYSIMHLVKYFGNHPGAVILPINIRSMSPSWDLHPINQKSEVVSRIRSFLEEHGYHIDELHGTDKPESASYQDFLKISVSYPLTNWDIIGQFEGIINTRPENDEEKAERYKKLFLYHYLHQLRDNNRKFILLKKTVELLISMNVNVFSYITPVNYQAGEEYVGEDFSKILSQNTKMISDYFASIRDDKVKFQDFSQLLERRFFAHLNDSTEHMNQDGRSILLQNIIQNFPSK